MRVFKFVSSILASLVLVTVTAPSAQADVPPIPLTCGMVIKQDAKVYLAKDLRCPTFGVRVQSDFSGEVPGPTVVIDLRGHTLRGPGTGEGITAFSGGQGITFVTVTNGRLKNWDIAVGGDWDFRTRNVALVNNRIGFYCSSICVADRTHFKGNTGIGFNAGADASSTVTRSTFVRNAVGAAVSFIWTLRIDNSVFRKNDVGVLADNARVTVSKSLFVRNRTAVKVLTGDLEEPCATLQQVVFVRNTVNLDGERCPA